MPFAFIDNRKWCGNTNFRQRFCCCCCRPFPHWMNNAFVWLLSNILGFITHILQYCCCCYCCFYLKFCCSWVYCCTCLTMSVIMRLAYGFLPLNFRHTTDKHFNTHNQFVFLLLVAACWYAPYLLHQRSLTCVWCCVSHFNCIILQ